MCAAKKIKFIPRYDFEFSVRDLLDLSSPFGCVVSVQKIERCGRAYGLVTYSDASDALMATMEIFDIKQFVVELQTPNEEREDQNKGHQQYPPAYSQPEFLRINNLPKHLHERQDLVRLLPLNSTIVEMTFDSALVMLPDLPTVMMVKQSLHDLYT